MASHSGSLGAQSHFSNQLPHRPPAPAVPTDASKALNPSLPVPSPCLSFWHRTTRGFPYLHANHDAPVPSTSKYVIIGSGIAGALTARELLEQGVKGGDLLILEAREAVSGASGRNAGHVRPDAFRGFTAYSTIHGPEQAKKIIENERIVLERVDAFVRENNVPCDFELTTTFDVCLSQEFAEHQAKSFEAFKAGGGDVSHVKYYEGEEAKTKTRVSAALSAYEWPAGSSHPAKLAQWILKDVISKGGRLWTHCPATNITKHESPTADGMRWDIHTPRGVVSSETVIHCTNAYAAYLLPSLSNFVTPNRAQAHSFVPTFTFSGENTIDHTMSLRYGLRHFFSLIQRRMDGTLVLGVSRTNPEWSDETNASIRTFDDTKFNETIAETARKEFAKLFPESTASAASHGQGLDHIWTGIIGMTPDSVPMVGAVEGLDGQWICAGFNGHGMARIFTCAPGVVKLILGQSWETTGLPECFQFSNERLSGTKKQNVKSVW